jgi:fatty-acyl-CoA synthase
MNLSWITGSVFDAVATCDPDATAFVVDLDDRATYAELELRAIGILEELVTSGVRRGDRVAILMANSVTYAATYFATLRLGAIAVRLNWRLSMPELDHVLRDAGCSLVVLDDSMAELVSPALQLEVSALVVAGRDRDHRWEPAWGRRLRPGSGRTPVPPPTPPIGLDDPAMLMYTSGTSGHPKGSVWTHGNTLWASAMQVMKFGFGPDTVAMTSGPFYHAGAFEVFLLPALLARGRAVGLRSRGFTVDRLVEVIRTEQVTHALIYPFMLYELFERADLDLSGLGSLRVVVSGGDPVQPWLVEAFAERLPGTELVATYGLTEAGGCCTFLDFDDFEDHRTTVGRPLPLTQVAVVDEQRTPVPTGEEGEIAVRGPAVATSYWNNDAATVETFVDGWCLTGDLGRVCGHGFLSVTGRKKDMIRSGGENIYPAEVEAVLRGHPDVVEVAVVAVPDPRFLEVGCAVVVTEDGLPLDADALQTWCRSRLAAFKVPRHVVSVAELPRNGVGKVLKHVLRDRYRDLTEAR